MLDRNPGMAGHRMVFTAMVGFAVLGVLITTLLINMIKKKQKISPAAALKDF